MKRLVLAALSIAAVCGCGKPADEVVVYVAVDRKDAERILNGFERTSGIKVRAVYDAEAAKTTGLVTRLVAEANRPRCDVFWNNEFVQTLLLKERGVLQPYASPAADVPSEFRDADGFWTGIATRARVIVYNTELVKAEAAPRSIHDLVKPEWRGKVAVANPQFGTTRTHVAALFAALGPEPAKDFLEALLANDARIVDGNAMVTNLVGRAQAGASPVLVGLTDTDDVLSGQADGAPIGMIYPDQDSIGTLIIPSTVCLIHGGPNPDHGRRLVDYLVGREVEEQFTAAGTGYSPIRDPSGEDEAKYIRGLQVTYRDVLEQLLPSSEWTAQHFFQ